MLGTSAANVTFMLANMIQKEPGVIIGPISKFLGFILNFIFNFAYMISVNYSLGISIIMLTIITRLLMLPLAFTQQKSMVGMQRLQPEIEKIRKKYPTTKDPEVQQKMNAEIQSLYSKNKVNPFSGCLPLFIQMPIFFALSYIMNTTYLFIERLGSIYDQLAQAIINVPKYTNIVVPMAKNMLPKDMKINISIVSDMEKVLNKFNNADWATLLSQLPAGSVDQIRTLFEQKQGIETFAGISLIDQAGFTFPGILIPIFAVLTTFLSSYLMSTMQKSADSNAKMQQRMMLIVMPIMMGVMTISLPAGVGLYWITSSVFQVGQQYVMNRLVPVQAGKETEEKKEKA